MDKRDNEMRFEITGQWEKEFEHDGMLYCAQRIEEMLMIYTCFRQFP
jgi:hypothetical protein